MLNQKYETKYQIILDTIKKNNIHYFNIYLYYDKKIHIIDKVKIKNINYENYFNNLHFKVLDKWKILNEIDTSVTNSIICSIIINNIYELKFTKNLLNSNLMIKNVNLKLIKLNENIYEIIYFGDFKLFRHSLERVRFNIFYNNDKCNIKLV